MDSIVLLGFLGIFAIAISICYFVIKQDAIGYLAGIFWVIFAADAYLTSDPIYYLLALGGIAGAFLMFFSGMANDRTKKQEAETEAENQRIAAESAPKTWRISSINKAKANAARRRAAKDLKNIGI